MWWRGSNARSVFGLSGTFVLKSSSVYAPLVASHVSSQSLVDNAFLVWSNLGIKTFEDFYLNHPLLHPFSSSQNQYSHPEKQFFICLKAESSIKKKKKNTSHRCQKALSTETIVSSIAVLLYSYACRSLRHISPHWPVDWAATVFIQIK